MASSPLPSRIALITGANKGIGLEIARQIAAKGGYHVLLGARDKDRGERAAIILQADGLSVEFIQLDVTMDASIAAAAKTISDKFGRLDVLVNNAGIAIDSWDPAVPIPPRDVFDKTFSTNTTGAAMVTEAMVPLLSNAKNPNVVFVSTDMGSLGIFADPNGRYKDMPLYFASYRCSKAAMNMLALVYAARFRGEGWRVNVHHPGYIATDLNSNQGYGTVQEGARNAVRLATLEGQGGESGKFSSSDGPVQW